MRVVEHEYRMDNSLLEASVRCRDFDVCRRARTAKTEFAADMDEIFAGEIFARSASISSKASDVVFWIHGKNATFIMDE